MVKALDCETTQDLLPASLLDALDVDEAVAVMEHLRRCPTCRAEADSLRPVVGAMGLNVPDAGKLSPHVKHRLMTQVGESIRPKPIIPARRWVFRPIAALVPAAIALIVIFGLGAWALSLQSQMAQQQARLDRLATQQVALRQFMMDANVQPVAVQFEGATSATAMMYLSGDKVAMAVEGLPPLQGDQVYQCWWMDEAKQEIVPGSTFKVDANGAGVWAWDRPQGDEYHVMAVTREPKPGNTKAEGPVILTAKF